MLTVTSIFTLNDPTDQIRLFEILDHNAATVLQHSSGFLGSTLSRSDDGCTIVNHAKWVDVPAVANMLNRPGAREVMQQAGALATTQVIRSSTVRGYLPA